MSGVVGRGIDRLRLWSATLRWWIVEATKILVWRGVVGTTLLLVGQLLQVGAVVMAIAYASWLVVNEPRTFVGVELVPRDSPGLLVGVTLSIAAILLIAATAKWLGAILMLKCRLWIERAIGERVVTTAVEEFRLPGGASRYGMLQSGEVLRLASRDGRAAGRVVRSIHLAVPALVLAIGAMGALFWISTPLTLALLPAFGVSSLALGNISRRAARASMRYEEAAPRAKSAIKHGLEGNDPASVFRGGDFEIAAQAYLSRLRGIPDSHFVTDILLAVLFALILAVLGPGGADGDRGWERIVAYLVGLRVLQANLRQVGGQLAGINRFYPQLRRLQKALMPTPARDTKKIERWPIHARGGAGSRIELSRGSRLAVVVPVAWSPLVAGALARGLATSPARARRMLRSMTVATEDLEATVSKARSTGRWIVVVPESSLDPAPGRDVFPEAPDLAWVIVHRKTADDLPRHGEAAVVGVDLVEEHGPLVVAAAGSGIDDAALRSADEPDVMIEDDSELDDDF